jgi:hypothetical protein
MEVCHVPFVFMACQTHLLGFPPADHNVRKFLSSVESNPEISFSRACHFLKALFCTTTMTIKDLGTSRANRIEQFRAHMSKGQSMDKTGTERRDFYEKVILMAMEVRCTSLMSLILFEPLGLF